MSFHAKWLIQLGTGVLKVVSPALPDLGKKRPFFSQNFLGKSSYKLFFYFYLKKSVFLGKSSYKLFFVVVENLIFSNKNKKIIYKKIFPKKSGKKNLSATPSWVVGAGHGAFK